LGLNPRTLLERNVLPAGATASVGSAGLVLSELTCSDPWHDDFIVPAWVRTPMNLVDYYVYRMQQRYGKDGKAWLPPLGTERVIYVRAAKQLIDTLGRERAVRFVADSVAAAFHPPSLQWVVNRLQKVVEGEYTCPQIRPPTEKQSTLLP